MLKNWWFWVGVHVYISWITNCAHSSTHMGILVRKMVCWGFVSAHAQRIPTQKCLKQCSSARKKWQLFHKISNFHDPLSVWSVTIKPLKCTLQDAPLPPKSVPLKKNCEKIFFYFLQFLKKKGSFFGVALNLFWHL